jgi:large subunit ribosomal protein L19
MDLIEKLQTELGKRELPSVHVGDTVEVHYLIREGDKERVQLFIGTIIAIKGRGVARTITVRRIVQGEGVERIFPLHSPRVKDVVITRRGEVRRAKLYFLRDRVGKKTRVKELLGEKVRREREFEKAMRASMSEDADNPAPGEALPRSTPSVPVNV